MRSSKKVVYNIYVFAAPVKSLKTYHEKKILYPLPHGIKCRLLLRRAYRALGIKLMSDEEFLRMIIDESHLNRLREEYSIYISTRLDRPEKNYFGLKQQLSTRADPYGSRTGNILAHPHEGARRTDAADIISSICKGAGYNEHQYQASAQRTGDVYSREYHWPLDMIVNPMPFKPEDNDAIVMIDVDYYVDMNAFLLKHNHPVLLYTFQPETTGGSYNEYNFAFDADNNVTYSLQGATTFKHKVWNYIGDVTHVSGDIPRYFEDKPFYKRIFKYNRRNLVTKTYRLMKISHGLNRAIVCLVPLYTSRGYDSMLVNILMPTKPLETLSVAEPNGFARMKIMKDNKLFVSTSFIDTAFSCVLPYHVDVELYSKAQRTNALYYANIKKTVEAHKSLYNTDFDAAAASEIVLTYRLSEQSLHPLTLVDAPLLLSKGVHHFLVHNSPYESNEDITKPTMLSFMKPIIDLALAPIKNTTAEKQAIHERVFDNTKLKQPNWFTMFCNEFIDFIIPDSIANTIEPVTMDIVYERQNSPSQKAILNRAQVLSIPAKGLTKSFLKTESVLKLGPARLVSTADDYTKLHSSTFMYALADHLKTFDWYAPGKSPLKIAQRIVNICEDAETACASDFSKFDGHCSLFLRKLQIGIMLKAFPSSYHEHIMAMYRNEVDLLGIGQFNTQYDTYYSILSGLPSTSSFGTLGSAFITYCSFRRTKSYGSGFIEPETAWSKLGIYGGDDGFTSNLGSEVFTDTAKKLGQVVTVDIIKRGELGVTFLSRNFGPDVWTGDLSSCCSVLRTVSKFHTHVRRPENFKPWEFLCMKAYAYYLTDRDSPIIGPLVQRVKELASPEYMESLEHNKDHMSWFSWFKTDNWPQYSTEWMLSTIEDIDNLGFNHDDYHKWLAECKTLDDLMDCPAFCCPFVTHDLSKRMKDGCEYMVNGEIVKPEKTLSRSKRKKMNKLRELRQKSKPKLVEKILEGHLPESVNQAGLYASRKSVVNTDSNTSQSTKSTRRTRRGKRSKRSLKRLTPKRG
jgi:hypothetical protein